MSRAGGLAAALALLASATLGSARAGAAPDFSAPRDIGHFRVYPDFELEHRYYLAPGEIEIARDDQGRPDLHFLQLRYTGTALTGDQGESESHSTLTVRLRQDAPTPVEERFVKRALRDFANLGRVELRPLPIVAFEAILVYTPIGDAAQGSGELSALEDGHFEAEDGEAAQSSTRGYWRERTFTVPMNQATSSLLWQLFQRGEVAISLSYAFFSRGVDSAELVQADVQASEREAERQLLASLEQAGVPLAAQPERGVAAKLLERLRAERRGEEPPAPDSEPAAPPERTRMVHAGATALRVDARRWPDLFQRIDYNEQLPPAYAFVKIYCYDFANALRPDLFYKKVEIEAAGVGGRMIGISTKFLFSQPELYARTVRFPFAVEIDRPYRYRVVTATRSGETREGPWIERDAWGAILDVTSAPTERAGEGEG